MKRLLTLGILLVALGGCAPELVPVPIKPAATAKSPTLTPLAISGPTVPAPGLVSIHMVDESNGWGINDSAVLRTADGGRTWHSIGPSDASALGYAADSDFLDAMHAWMLVPDPNDMLKGTLYRTANGGADWSKSVAPFGGGDLHFLDSSHGWMMASLGAGAGSMAVAVFQSTDGGATWAQTFTNDPNQPTAGDGLPLGGLKDGLTALDMKTAWIGGVTYAPGVIYLYQTHDGGRTWTPVTVTAPAGYEQAEFETTGPIFASPEIAFLPVHISSQNGVMLAVYVSRDGGTSWVLSPTFIPMGGPLDVVSPQTCIAWNGTSFYVTQDGAQTWTSVSPDVKFGDNFSGLDFISSSVGYVLTNDGSGSTGLYMTSDGGTSWNMLSH